MLKHYLAIAWRHMLRQPLYTLLNVAGLAVGIAATLFILLYLDFELHFDSFHTNKDRLFRVDTKGIKTHKQDLEVDWNNVPRNFGVLAKADYPEIEDYVGFYRFFEEEEVHFDVDGVQTKETAVYLADANVLEIFSFELMAGNPLTALKAPNKIIISESLARRMFGKEKALGKIIKTTLSHTFPETDPNYSLEVTGVFKDLPPNTHLEIAAMLSAETDPHLHDHYFNRFNTHTYFLLQPEADPLALAPKLTSLYDRYLDPEREPVMVSARHELIPITDIHLANTGGLTYIYLFSGIGVLLLLIALISYVNLVTAQASRRALEVGVRKVIGSQRLQLVFQFLTESMLLTSIALLMALSLVFLLVEPVNQMLSLQLRLAQLWQPFSMLGMLGILLAIGVLGGSYPAFFLSSFTPLTMLKGKLQKGVALRSGLVSVQFAVVIFVLTCTGMIYLQLQFMRNKDLGFDQTQLIRLTLSGEDWDAKYDVLKEQLLQHTAISSVGSAGFVAGMGEMGRRPISAEGAAGPEPQFVHFGQIDYDYLATMGMVLADGRNFSTEFQNDARESVLINESFAHAFGLDHPVGAKIRFGDQGNPNFETIVGVVKDFHESTLHQPIGAQLFLLGAAREVVVKVDGDVQDAIQYIEKSWEGVYPNTPFEFQFLKEELAAAYATDQVRGKIFIAFSILTIFIAFLGLFGLASYVSIQRSKELAIRKVLGARLADLLHLLTKDFLLLVLMAALPGFLAAWWMIKSWLANFAYQTEISYLLFGQVFLFTLLLVLITTGIHAFRAALLNPSNALQSE
ncbi:MAG: ABC transporter permease [Saprospiraceae bacterium]